MFSVGVIFTFGSSEFGPGDFSGTENSSDQPATKQADVEYFIRRVVITVIFRVLQLIVVNTCEYPINRLTNSNPVYKSVKHMTVVTQEIWPT
jgi:hypothetical protein